MKKALILLLLMVSIGTTIMAQIRTVNIPSNHLILNGNIITVKNWGPKFDGDYDVIKLATDSCVSGNCVDGDGRKILVNITNNIPTIRIMEGKFKHDAFLGHGVMLVDGEGQWYDGTYEIGKYKADYKHNDLYATATFNPKDLNETIEGHFDGYLDGGIGSALSQYRKFVVCRFRPLYESKKTTVWEQAIYPLERDAELKAIYASAEYKAARAIIEAREAGYKNNPAPLKANNSSVSTSTVKAKTTCSECHGRGRIGHNETQTQFRTTDGSAILTNRMVYETCRACGGSGYK